MDPEICMRKTGIVTTSDYKHFFLKTTVLYLTWKTHVQNIFLKTSKMPEKREHVWHAPQDFIFRLHLILKQDNS